MTTQHANSDDQGIKAAVNAALDYLGRLSPESLVELGKHYSENVYFKDPFQEVRGLAAVQTIYSHMFSALKQPRFVITSHVQQGPVCFVTWDFNFAVGSWQAGKTQCIRGATELRMHQTIDGWRIESHRDYWDTAEELYEKLPILGALMRWLKRHFATPQT